MVHARAGHAQRALRASSSADRGSRAAAGARPPPSRICRRACSTCCTARPRGGSRPSSPWRGRCGHRVADVVEDPQRLQVPRRRDVLGQEADVEVVDDLERLRVDDVHGVALAVRHVDARRGSPSPPGSACPAASRCRCRRPRARAACRAAGPRGSAGGAGAGAGLGSRAARLGGAERRGRRRGDDGRTAAGAGAAEDGNDEGERGGEHGRALHARSIHPGHHSRSSRARRACRARRQAGGLGLGGGSGVGVGSAGRGGSAAGGVASRAGTGLGCGVGRGLTLRTGAGVAIVVVVVDVARGAWESGSGWERSPRSAPGAGCTPAA